MSSLSNRFQCSQWTAGDEGLGSVLIEAMRGFTTETREAGGGKTGWFHDDGGQL